jgi:opacity protein-like surface antigen
MALAAEPTRPAAAAPVTVPPAFTWAGFYVGVNAGYGFSDHDRNDFCGAGFALGLGTCFGGSGLEVPAATGNVPTPVVPLTGFNPLGSGFRDHGDRGGFVGGGQVGYNYQFTPGSGFVVGMEVDVQGVGFGRHRGNHFFPGLGGNNVFTAAGVDDFGVTAGAGIAAPTGIGPGGLGNVALFDGFNRTGFGRGRSDWLATARGRLGYAFDRLLIYGTAGVAFTGRRNKDDCFGCTGFGSGIVGGASLFGTGFFVPGADPTGAGVAATTPIFDDRHSNDVGPVVGGGVEYAITDNLTAKIEGLYVNFGNDRNRSGCCTANGAVVGVTNTGAPVTVAGFGFDDRHRSNDLGIVRVGLNWNFNAPSAAPAATPGPGANVGAPKELPPEAKAPEKTELIGFAAGARLQTDYNFRGISQSNHEPSPQTYGELQLFDNFLYSGIAIYKVDLPTRPPVEMDLTAGIRPKLGPLQFDFGIIYYNYPNERRLLNFLQTTDYTLPDGTVLFTGPTILTVRNTDFLEGAAKVSWSPTDALTFGANVFHTSNWLGSHAPGTYASLTGKYSIPQGAFGFLPEGFSISAEAGRYYLGTTSPQLGRVRLPDYNYGNVGLSYTYKNFTFDVRYHDTNLSKRECFTLTTDPQGVFTGSGRSNWCDSRVIGTITFDFTTKEPGLLASLAP